MNEIAAELAIYIAWYNLHRPHQFLKGRTPEEVYLRAPPVLSIAEGPNSELPEVSVEIAYFEARKQLPVFSLKKAA